MPPSRFSVFHLVKNWPHAMATWLASLWVGGMAAVGYLAVPALFHALPDNRMLAGALAGQLFAAMAYAGMVCAAYLLAYAWWRGGRVAWRQGTWWLVLCMLALLLLGQFLLQPQMAALKAQALPLDVMHSDFAARFAALHGVASVLYLLQCLLGLGLLLRVHALRPAT
ncbi:MAG TPA: DUF4149 domain-containing protein [Gallionellaceae bacterium]